MRDVKLPNGLCLYWEDNGVGGRTYYSDEVGGGVFVWDTCLVSSSTLLAAIAQEDTLIKKEKQNEQIRTENPGVEKES